MTRNIITCLALFLCLNCFSKDVIDPSLQAIMSKNADDKKIRIGILMKEQARSADLLSITNTFATNRARREYVTKTLKQQAETSQADLMQLLKQMQDGNMVDKIHSVWMMNAIQCDASKEAITILAQRSDIQTIYHCQPGILPPTVDATARPTAITRGITDNVLMINADKVWELGYTGEGVIVGHLDTGVNYNHLDLQGRMWDGGEEYPHHGIDVFDHDNDPMDGWGHGTHVAGTIAGTGTAGTQTGVAPGCTIMEIKVFSDVEDEPTDEFVLADGMQFAVEHGAQVLNMSLGKPGDDPVFRLAMRQICDNMLAAGITVVTTAGNYGDFISMLPLPYNIGCPGSIPSPWMHPDQAINAGGLSSVICVGSTNYEDQASSFSSPGPGTWSDITEYADYPYVAGDSIQIGIIKPDVCAPGSNVTSLGYPGIDSYKANLGTSFAAPAVTGTIALMLAKNPELTPAQIDEILETTAVNPYDHKNNDYGSGRIDALAAIMAMDGCAPVNNLDYTILNDTVRLVWNGSADNYLIFADGNEVGSTSDTHFDLVLDEGEHELCVAPSECPALKSCVSLEFVGLDETSTQANVYPNPNTGSVTVDCTGMTEVHVFAIDGKLMRRITATNGSCHIEGLNNGIYLLRITTTNGTLNQKIVTY